MGVTATNHRLTTMHCLSVLQAGEVLFGNVVTQYPIEKAGRHAGGPFTLPLHLPNTHKALISAWSVVANNIRATGK